MGTTSSWFDPQSDPQNQPAGNGLSQQDIAPPSPQTPTIAGMMNPQTSASPTIPQSPDMGGPIGASLQGQQSEGSKLKSGFQKVANYGIQYLLHSFGLPTDQDLQDRALRRQQVQAGIDEVNANIAKAKDMMTEVPMIDPATQQPVLDQFGQPLMVRKADQGKLLVQYLKNKGSANVAGINAQGKVDAVTASKTTVPTGDIGRLYGQAVQKAIESGNDPAQDPAVQQYKSALDVMKKSKPGSLEQQYADAIESGDKRKQQVIEATWQKSKVEPGVARAMVFVNGRAVPMEDPESGATYYTSAGQAKALGNQGFGKGTNFQKNAFLPAARFADIDRAATAVDKSIPALDNLPDYQRGLVIDELRNSTNLRPGMLSSFLRSNVYKDMTPQARSYVTSVLSMREQIMAANQLLTGSATTSDSRTEAIWNTLPDGTEPDADMARRKMELTHGMIQNLKSGYPLIDKIQKGASSNTGQPKGQAPIVQRNKTTGAYRYSLDGGNTWVAGQPR